MTARLKIPQFFGQDFEHAVICTFSADLAFYERALFRTMRGFRTQLVLADRGELLAELADQADGDGLAFVNREYLASPVRSPGSAHAKLILLTGGDRGILLVGSGNLGLRGYAGRGELFFRYDHPSKANGQLAAFGAARDFLRALVDRGYLDGPARKALSLVWDATPWLGEAPAGGSPLRHNLDRSLLDQLIEAVAGERVQHITVHSPFYDKDCCALRQLAGALRPQRLEILVQPGSTSVDALALRKVMADHRGTVRAARPRSSRRPDVHAKFVIARTARHAFCLQGSANVTRAGLCSAHDEGNIELANLLVGAANAFDDVLADLTIEKDPLDLREDLLVFSARPAPEVRRYELVSATWNGSALSFELRRALPAGATVAVMAREREIARIDRAPASTTFGVKVSPEDKAFAQAIPIHLRLEVGRIPELTNPVYPYNEPALRYAFRDPRRPDLLARVGSLDLDDEELEELLEQLRSALALDPAGLRGWHAVEDRDVDDDTDEDAPHIAWDAIDWDEIRRHPRYAQYLRRPTHSERSDLQITLDAITEHFRDYAGPRPVDSIHAPSPPRLDGARTRRPRTAEQRARLIWRNFVRRCLRAIQSEKFAEVMGPAVVVANAVIIDHLIRALTVRHVLDTGFALKAQAALWSRLVGQGDHPGYLSGLTGTEGAATMRAIEQQALPARVLGEMYEAALRLRGEELRPVRLALREICRAFVVSPLFGPALRDLPPAVRWSGAPSATALVGEIERLCEFVPANELAKELALRAGTTSNSVRFIRVTVSRGGKAESVDEMDVDDPRVEFTPQLASELLYAWEASSGGDYFRAKHLPSGALALIDLRSRTRLHATRGSDGRLVDTTLPLPRSPETPWRTALGDLRFAAVAADRTAAHVG